MTTVDSISVGCFPPHAAQLAATPGAAGGHVPCSLFVPYLVPGSQWLRVYDFLLHSMTHAARKNTENRPEDLKLWPLECLNKGRSALCMHIGMCELEATLDLQRTPYA